MNHELLRELGKNTEVTGVASGTKVRNGVNTGEPCIVVYVPRKRPLSELSAKERIPAKIGGKIVDIQESVFKALSLLPAPVRPQTVWTDGGSHQAGYRPAVGGISIGHYSVTAGTLATAVYLPSGQRVILSNNHVLANCNEASVGDDIYQPGVYDGGTVSDKLGELYDWIPVVPEGSGAVNEVDAAIALPTNQSDLDSIIADVTDAVTESKSATVGMAVTKSGRTTYVTENVVAAIDGAIRVQYPSWVASFVNQIVINSGSFIAGGDSGSACLEMPDIGDPYAIVGLVFAGSSTQGVVCPIAPIIEGFDLKFSMLVDLQGTVKRNGQTVSGARVVAFNLTTEDSDYEFLGYAETDGNGYYTFPDSVWQFNTVVVFAQYNIGLTEYSGFRRIHCKQITNHAVINISEYSPVPDGLWCTFKLPGDFLTCNIAAERYYSNLY